MTTPKMKFGMNTQRGRLSRPDGSKRAKLEHLLCASLLFKHFLLLAVMIIVGTNVAWGQEQTTDYSGVYYIASVGYDGNPANTNNYYLCPTEGWCYYKADDDFWPSNTSDENKTMPFLTTYRCKTSNYHDGDPNDAIWIIEKKIGTDYYYIKQASTGRYLTSNGTIRTTGNADRMRVHLEAVAPENLDDKELFTIAAYSTYLTISPKGVVGSASGNNWLTVNGGNKNSLVGAAGKQGGPTGYTNTAGIIGVYTQADANAKFYLEKALSIDAPTITNNNDGTFTITAESGATIYYTTDGSTPTTSSYTGTGTTSVNITLTDDITVIKAIAKATSDSDPFPTNVTTYKLPACERPVISISGGTVTITCATEGATIYYTTDGTPATASSTTYTAPFDKGDATSIRAIATKPGYVNSSEAKFLPIKEISSLSEIEENPEGHYKLIADITSAGSGLNIVFEGELDGNFHTISGLRGPLFASTNEAVIKNVVLKDVRISQSGSIGAITGVANGYTRIYNCGILPSSNKYENETSDISSTDGYCGGLVGRLTDDSRVINCFSYANITGGTDVAGIVGHVDAVSGTNGSDATVTNDKYSNLRTAVVNCMFYGNITGGSNIYPVYGGAKMLNTGEYGINNYDFYRAEASITPSDYNCSWPASEENLTRFEYYRSLLNANRELCGWWVKSDVAPSTLATAKVQAIKKDASLIAKWVLDPSIAPYPILKPAGKYFSVINIDPARRTDPDTKAWEDRNPSANTIETNTAPDIHGETLGSISVSINAGSHHSGSDSRSITITAMDIDNNDFCYGKIQLPYYNEIFGNPDGTTWSEKYGDNYTDMVVTGWDITTSEGTAGIFSEDPIAGYNFADRNCTAKDTHRTFAQGGFYYVPYGVTSITITAHWAKAYYLSNTGGNYERVYFSESNVNKTSAGQPFAPAGTRSFGSGEFGGQTINNRTIASILADNNTVKENSVYDCAIVLVSNYQYRSNLEHIADNNRKPFTLMTVDLDFDNEPDYCFEWQFGGGDQGVTRAYINPVRFDFLPIVELGIAMKENDSKYLFSIGKLTPYGQFEITETALIHMGQFEYDDKNRAITGPVILNNGTFDQICRGSESDGDQNVNYFILGGHVKMPSFTPGSHVKTAVKSRHCAVNVLGGEIANFYLSGNYIATPTNEGNPHCYIDGGKLDFVASGAKEKINGDVFWKIDHAYIGEFYGGGINANKAVTGDISITINRSKVTKFCGGPQFGNMASGKTVTTNATGTTFGVFYGAGNGGTCYSQYDQSDVTSSSPNTYNWETNNNSSGKLANYTALKYINKATGYHAKYELEMINSSAGTMNNAVCRTYMYSAQFATTNTGHVTSTLTDCTIEGNFFGGGLLGGVNGNVTSTLMGNTVVQGNAYGAGYGVADLTVDVLPKGYTPPKRDENTAVITAPQYPDATTYYWTHDTTFGSTTLSTSSPAILNPNGDGKNYLYTEIPLDNLGTVTGDVFLTIDGTTTVTGNVYGGGESSTVGGNITVNIKNGTVSTDVYGGGALANTNTDGLTKNTVVNLTGGTINGNVYGGAMGDEETEAKVGNVHVILNGTRTTETVDGQEVTTYLDNCVVKGNIFGCNNLNGTPRGSVTVEIFKTAGDSRTAQENLKSIDDQKHKYQLAAVYGGGNLAEYLPDDLNNTKTHVIIHGCDLTSIRTVYGGGNAASTPATQVDVYGTYEIEEVFGGGNGKDRISRDGGTTFIDNPGANVGFHAYADDDERAQTAADRATNFQYGSGQASVNIYGGLIHRVFGGSNTKGNVRVVAVTMLDSKSDCEFQVDEAYGGGKSAPMDGAAQLIMSCIPGLKAAYGGAEEADIHNDVILNITNGTFDRVFGGNNVRGTIDGTITVNVEETGCRPIIIGQLYGGGNQAPYEAPFVEGSTTERRPGPTLNVRSFTSIGEVYGGGYGATAVVTGDTHVNINVSEGLYKDQDDKGNDNVLEETIREISYTEFRRTTDGDFVLDNDSNRVEDKKTIAVIMPSHAKGAIGAIYNVYGGGNAANVIGNTFVNIGTATDDQQLFATPTDATEAERTKAVIGADIRGNVYGGGNAADVTGNTNVKIGR